jgi:hypothetical protein
MRGSSAQQLNYKDHHIYILYFKRLFTSSLFGRPSIADVTSEHLTILSNLTQKRWIPVVIYNQLGN